MKSFQHKNWIGYLASKNYEEELQKEFKFHKLSVLHKYNNLFLVENHPDNIKITLSQNIWLYPETHEIKSINHASSVLRSINTQWKYYPYEFWGRCKIIESKLPKYKLPSKLTFPFQIPASYSLSILFYFDLCKIKLFS